MLDTVINGVYDALEGVLDWFLGFMGFCPFDHMEVVLEGCQEGLGWLNWFVPIHSIVTVLELGCTAFLTYYAIKFLWGFLPFTK